MAYDWDALARAEGYTGPPGTGVSYMAGMVKNDGTPVQLDSAGKGWGPEFMDPNDQTQANPYNRYLNSVILDPNDPYGLNGKFEGGGAMPPGYGDKDMIEALNALVMKPDGTLRARIARPDGGLWNTQSNVLQGFQSGLQNPDRGTHGMISEAMPYVFAGGALGMVGAAGAAGGGLAGAEGGAELYGGIAGDTLGASAIGTEGAGAGSTSWYDSLYNSLAQPGMTDAAIGAGGLTAAQIASGVSTGGDLASDTLQGPYSPDPGGGSTGGGLPSWLSSLLPGGGAGLNYNDLIRGLVGGVGGYLSADAMADAYRDTEANRLAYLKAESDKYFGVGAPYREDLQASYEPGFNLWSQPGYAEAARRAANVSTRAWSGAPTGGNPANNPGVAGNIYQDVLTGTTLPALANYRGQLGQFGGLGLNTAGAAGLAGADTTGSNAATASMGQGYNALGWGLNTAMGGNDPYEEMAKRYGITVSGQPYGR